MSSTKRNNTQTNPQAQLTRRAFILQAAALPAAALPTVPIGTVQSGEWLKKAHVGVEHLDAYNTRIRLYNDFIYPASEDISGAETHNAYEANCREELRQLIPLLHRNDLIALAKLAKLLFTQPPTPELFEEIQRRTNESREQLAVQFGRKPQRKEPEISREKWEEMITVLEDVVAEQRARYLG